MVHKGLQEKSLGFFFFYNEYELILNYCVVYYQQTYLRHDGRL